jgi:hypothetical protein
MSPDEEYDFYGRPENQQPQGPPRRRASQVPDKVAREDPSGADADGNTLSAPDRPAVEHG